MKQVKHTFDPVYDQNSEILILGSMPSVKSREYGFYYMHPKNRFWKILETLYQEDIPKDNNGKIAFLKKHHIALYDVLETCEIHASDDHSIEKPVCHDFTEILKNSHIHTIFTTGKIATHLYEKYCYPKTKIKSIYLPSTSPANAKMKLEDLVQAYQQIKK